MSDYWFLEYNKLLRSSVWTKANPIFKRECLPPFIENTQHFGMSRINIVSITYLPQCLFIGKNDIESNQPPQQCNIFAYSTVGVYSSLDEIILLLNH